MNDDSRAAAGSNPHPPYLSVPVWDVSDEEIAEWRKSKGLIIVAYTAECIRDGRYDRNEELYPEGSVIYREVSRAVIDKSMRILAERNMVLNRNGKWYANVPGRMEPSLLRAVNILLARRPDLPPDLAAALDSWKRALDALAAGQTVQADQAGKPTHGTTTARPRRNTA
jgi:(2Fe-2S) ferredoxin